MNKHGTILGHLVGWGLSRRYEDAATEGLAYLLRQFEPLRQQFVALLRAAQPGLTAELHFATQLTTEGGRPDMVGKAGDALRVFVEAKFWAGLTEHQPLSYLQQLQQRPEPSLLMVVVPRARIAWIWREIRERLGGASVVWSEVAERNPQQFAELVAVDQVRLGITSWEALLAALRVAAADDPRALADLEQLAGVCGAADEDAMRPLVREELSDPQVPTRLLQYATIVQDAVEKACQDVLTIHGLRPTHSWTTIGRYVQFAGNNAPGAWFGVDLELWRKYEAGPIWLEFSPGMWGQATQVRERIAAWVQENNFLMCFLPSGGIALHMELLTNREQDAVVGALVEQIRTIGKLLVG
ncbi:hypothetical protein [Nannocystis punicea]|uniref:PD-(D/E)XK nuclease superfamily protein n=1 Tax=Nannocystis punicea TaxID=2995304 RepID=A0ABY7H7L4_9BACT|nr:hypothetical protein [Nannocystis poenicansa]WAS95264.1 hypothetical protein O0S08_03815 [Nannocystis poenicansa]